MTGDEVVAFHPDLKGDLRIGESLQRLAHDIPAPGVDLPPEGRGGDSPERAAGVGADGDGSRRTPAPLPRQMAEVELLEPLHVGEARVA
jgi:hypothetical protein